jgi:chromosome segregation protein
LQIKRLKLTGFKSFVEPTELRIEPGLTGVVGPNGCGKSNLLEAIRWVMGEGSAKSLRGSGMEDVIFAGTASRPSRDFAEVTILAELDADNDAINIGGDMEVVRRIERGAGSAYRLNGRDVRAKDVALLFADAATGAHSPALVSQGKISAVISAKPAERRAMLEEAAGISGLHVRRKDAEQKLRATETNLTRLDEVLGDMENRANALRRQARAAERYRKLSTDIRVAEGRLIFSRWREAADAATKARAEAATADAAVAAAGQAQQEAAQKQSEAVTALADARSTAQAARDAATEAAHRLSTLSGERAQLDRRISDLAAQTRQLEADRAREGQLAHDAADALTRLAEETKLLATRIKVSEMEQPGFAHKLSTADAKVRDAEVELAQALAAQAREQAETRVADAAFDAARMRSERAAREQTRIDAELNALPDTAPFLARRQTAQQVRTDAETTAREAELRIDAAELSRADAAARQAQAEAAQSTAQATLSALEGEAKALTRALEQGSGRNRALDQVRADPGFERALAAALGDDLDAAVGEGEAQGWRGANVLGADPAMPAGCASLADHVQAPAELRRRLSQIAVADADTGQSLAVGQRLVTREGWLRRWDGFVSDGEGAAAAERLERVNRLAALEGELPVARSTLESLRATFHAARTAAAAAREEGDTARKSLAQAELRAREAAREDDQLAIQIERFSGQRAEAEARLERSKAEAGEARNDVELAEVARRSLPDGTGTTAVVAKLQSASEAARASASQIKADALALERALSSDRQRQASAEHEQKGWKARSGEAANRIAEMAKRTKSIEAEALSLVDAPEKLSARISAAEEANSSAAIRANETAAAERLTETALREAEDRVQQLGEALANVREARAGAVARAENQELRRVEMGRVSGERFECPPPLLPDKAGFDEAEVREPATESAQLERLTADRERLGPVNLVAEAELNELDTEREKSAAERNELAEAVNRLRGSIGSLNREGRTRLLAAFEEVNTHFQRLFGTLFNGGQAHLALIDSDDPLEAGLEIFAQPPGKRLAALTLLSGGEQALTAVALIFGLFLTNPAPICVLDEVDAPLDDANIERFCGLLEKMTQETRTRYLIVTHNAVTMSRMHRLFGVTMVEQGVSRLVSVDLQAAEELLAVA